MKSAVSLQLLFSPILLILDVCFICKGVRVDPGRLGWFVVDGSAVVLATTTTISLEDAFILMIFLLSARVLSSWPPHQTTRELAAALGPPLVARYAHIDRRPGVIVVSGVDRTSRA